MPTSSSTTYKIKVLIVGRKDAIESHTYPTREEAETDLTKITDARQGRTDVELPWLQMPGDQVQAAYIDETTSSISWGSIGIATESSRLPDQW